MAATYQSLYRRHRPQRFAELVGQEHVTTALRNAVRDEKVGHAYLFSGPRGTGKTTTARVLAKALNCSNLGDDGEPCGECESCVAIAQGRFLDLFELDAASNNSVENIRELTDSVHLGIGAGARRKVYLIDEVHMLSAAASNALLKTLEEPPEHVVFVLATTNPEKVLPTIRSRTQHFELALLTVEQLVALLSDVLAREGVEADPAAIEVVARAGGGSARDALSLLDQALAHDDGSLHADAITDLFGVTPFEQRAAILEAVAAEDPAGALIGVGGLLDAGHEPRRVAEDLLRSARDAFLLHAAAGRVGVESAPGEHDRLAELGRTLGNSGTVRAVETLGQAVVDMRGTDAADPRLVLEVALVRLARRDGGPPIQTLAERVERLERAAAVRPAGSAGEPVAPPAPGRALGALRRERSGAVDAPAPPAPRSATEPASAPVIEPKTDDAPPPEAFSDDPDAAAPDEPSTASPPKASAPEAAPARELEIDDVVAAWAGALDSLPVPVKRSVQEAQPVRVEGNVVVFGVPPHFLDRARTRFRQEADAIRAALAEPLGADVKFKLEPHEGFLSGGSGAVEPEPEPEPPGGSGAVDSLSSFQDKFGATVVEEQPH
jgi:DNA polymerase III subunit gamma/tau